MTKPYVSYTVHNHIGTIEFYTPQHNSLPSFVLQELANTITHAGVDINCKVIILKSFGNKTFCAGASFDELLEITTKEQGLVFFSGFAHVINAMRLCTKFIIGRIQGKAIGGGVGLACTCDYTFGTIDASIKLSELAVGIGPFVVGPSVEKKMGTSAAYELAIDATNFRTAIWAKEKGLFNEVFNTIEELDVAILGLATTLAASSVEAMAAIKKAFWSNAEHWDTLLLQRAAISGNLVVSQETKTFLQQFKNK